MKGGRESLVDCEILSACQPKRTSSSTPALNRLLPACSPSLLVRYADVVRAICWRSLVAKESLGADLEAWCRFTRNTLVDTTVELDRTRWVIRCGEAPANTDVDRPVGSRLWLYTNFDCNLHCDYCCVRSSPKVPRRELGLARVRRIASEAAEIGVSEIFVTGGEPFLLADIGDILAVVRRRGADDGAHQRHAARRAAAPNASFPAKRSLDVADQP